MIDAMRAAGFSPPTELIFDDVFHRFHVEHDSPGSKNAWYVAHSDPRAGSFGDWKRGIKGKWSERAYREYTPEEKAAYCRNMEAAKKATEQELARVHAECREKSLVIWKQSIPAPSDHPYLVKKGVKSHGLHLHKGSLVIPIRDGRGTIHGLQFIAPEKNVRGGDKFFKTGTDKRGHYFSLGGKPETVLYLAEGYATAATIYEATGEPVAVCFDCGNLQPVAEALRLKFPSLKMVVCGDNDSETADNPGKTKATEAALSIHGLVTVPKLPEGAQGSDFNDLGNLSGLDEVQRQLQDAVYPSQTCSNHQLGDDDLEPYPLPDTLRPVMAFDYDLLPPTLEPWVRDICERMQCPPDFVAVSMVTALGALIGLKVGIRPQEKTPWTVVANQWAMVIGRPGVMKSPSIEAALEPFKRLIANAQKEYAEAEKNYQVDAARIELLNEANKKKARKELSKPLPGDITGFLQGMGPEPPSLHRYKTNDSTSQALGELLRQNSNGLLLVRDELVSLLRSLDREDQAEGRGFYLTAWNGDSAYTFDRIGRGFNLHIPAVCLSLLGGTQPGRMSEYVRQAVKGGAADDGLIQRFGLMVWPDINGEWLNVDRWPDTEAQRAALEVFDALDKLDPFQVGAEQDKGIDGEIDGLPYLRFDREAAEIFLEWRTELELRLRTGDLAPALESHFAKYRKLVPGLALILHLAAGGVGAVTKRATLQALAWAEYLESHAHRVYGSIARLETDAARTIIDKIRKGKLEREFSMRDVCRPGWSKLSDKELVKNALQLLVDHNWLSEAMIINTGGRHATVYRINSRAL